MRPTVYWGEQCVSHGALQWPLLPVSTKEPLHSHSAPGDSGHFPEKAEMTTSVTLAGNGPARLDLFLAMLFFFSSSATFNKCTHCV